jgi:hypothetical protein
MKNTEHKKNEIRKQIKQMSLDKLIAGGNAKDIIYVQVTGEVGTSFLIGDLVVCDMSLQPVLSDTVLCITDVGTDLKPYSEVRRFLKPLRLTNGNGQPIRIKIPFNSCEVIGVVTHILRTLVGST